MVIKPSMAEATRISKEASNSFVFVFCLELLEIDICTCNPTKGIQPKLNNSRFDINQIYKEHNIICLSPLAILEVLLRLVYTSDLNVADKFVALRPVMIPQKYHRNVLLSLVLIVPFFRRIRAVTVLLLPQLNSSHFIFR